MRHTMKLSKSIIASAIALSLITACNSTSTTQSATASTTQAQMSESEKANKLFDEIYMEGVNRNPVMQTYLGIKTDYDKWGDISEENTLKELTHTKKAISRIKALNFDALDKQTKLSYQLYLQQLENTVEDHKWRHHNYPVNQMFGYHSQIPSLLINQHSISNQKEAEDYISRLNNSEHFLNQLIEQLKIREAKGIIAPKFVFPHIIRD